MTRAGRIFSLFSLLATSAAWGSPQQNAILGASGEVYSAKAGTYGELFPQGNAVDSSHPVLALEVTTPDGKRERLLVEGTEGPGKDGLPFLHFEDSSETVFLLWETRFNVVHPMLMLSGYNGKTWIEPLEIIGTPFAPKTSPQFAVTQDVLEEAGPDGVPVTRRRTVLHLVWGDELSDGSIEAFYSPVILDDGVLVSHSAVFSLPAFDKSAVSSSDLSPEFAQGLAIRSGRDERTLVVTYPSPRTHRLVTIEIDSLPAQLGRLSDEARMHIIETGLKHSFPAGYKQVADLARMHIIETGVRFQPEIIQAIAAQVAQLILDNKGEDKLEVIADRARMHIIETGAKLSDRGLRTGTSTVEIKQTQADAASRAHLLGFRTVANWPAPTPEVTGKSVRFFPAKSGKSLIVAWPANGKIQYLESQDGGWSRVKEMILSVSLDLDRAYQVLEDKMSRN